jgi:uncharacterized phage-associated protein
MPMSTPPYDARAVSNFILDVAGERGYEITPLKLQKILYFSHGFFWACFGAKLVFNEFEAWDRGPVVRVVYEQFAHFGRMQITDRARWNNFAKSGVEVAKAEISEDVNSFVVRMVEIYGRVDAHRLSELSHVVGGPWDLARQAGSTPKRVIPDELIRSYFTHRIHTLGRH